MDYSDSSEEEIEIIEDMKNKFFDYTKETGIDYGETEEDYGPWFEIFFAGYVRCLSDQKDRLEKDILHNNNFENIISIFAIMKK